MNRSTSSTNQAPTPVTHAITEDSQESVKPSTVATAQPVGQSTNTAGVTSFVMAAIVFLIIAAAATMVLLSGDAKHRQKRHSK